MKDTSLYSTADERAPQLPSSDAEDYVPYMMADGTWLVLADMHIPYHRIEPIEAAVKYGRDRGVTGVLLLGDVQDCYQLSTFARDPRMRDFAGERDAVVKTLDYLDAQLKHPKVVFKEGNHEFRLQRYLAVKAPELLGCQEFEYKYLLRFQERGIDGVASEQLIYCGHLTIIHGHEFGGSLWSPVNPARGAFIRAFDCVLAAHQHQTSQHNDPTIRGKNIVCFSVGCLADLHPQYRPLNRWNWGFAIIEKQGNDFHVDNKRILPDGELV